MIDYAQCLTRILGLHPELHYGFLADPSGALIVEAGSKHSLSDVSVVDSTLQTESVVSFYNECIGYLQRVPQMVPRIYGQGHTVGIIGPPREGFLLAVFGVMPVTIAESSPENRARWSFAFRKRVWEIVLYEWPKDLR
jgi:hypothetical protein